MVGCEAVAAHHGVDAGFGAAEAFVKFHGGLGAATGEDVVDPGAGGVAVKDSMLLKLVKGIALDHFGPLVAVIAGCISAREDVRELR